MRTSSNDDYASVWNDSFDAYYGYEVVKCSKHGDDLETCGESDCDKVEWCFRFKHGDTSITLTRSELEEADPYVKGEEPIRYLLVGIGIMISDGFLTLQ